MKSIQEFLKKFRNFRLYAWIVGIAAALGAISSLMILILHQNFLFNEEGERMVGFTGRQIEAMVFFVAGLIALILGIVVAYLSYPYIFKRKERLEPNKALVWLGVAQGGLTLVQVIMTFIMVNVPEVIDYGTIEFVPTCDGTIKVFLIVFAVLGLLVSIVEFALIYPTLTVRLADEK